MLYILRFAFSKVEFKSDNLFEKKSKVKNILETKYQNMNSNSNNFVSAYQAYMEYFKTNIPFTPPPYQGWSENSERSLTNLSKNQNFENKYTANNNNTYTDKKQVKITQMQNRVDLLKAKYQKQNETVVILSKREC